MMLVSRTRTRPRAVAAAATAATRPLSTPSSSSSSSSRPRRAPLWKTPLRPGRVPAFDAALAYIRADARALRRELAALKTTFQHDPARADAGARAAYRERLWLLDVQSEVNLPEVRYAFATGRFSFARPVYRHLTEQQWRHDGPLDLLMERLHQMHVVPDVVPALHPTVDLRVQFPHVGRRDVHDRAREKQGFSTVEPGEYLAVARTLAPPRIAATVFHSDTRYYTLLMLDPDVPDPQHGSYTTFLHWMHTNIPLSATRRIFRIPLPDPAHLPYVPPHPHRGSGYHRYLLLLLPHPFGAPSPDGPAASLRLEIPVPADADRLGFSVRDFVHRWNIDLGGAVPRKGGALGRGTQLGGGGACMWRAVWDDGVPDIWTHVFGGAAEPRYGRLPKPEPYADTGNRHVW